MNTKMLRRELAAAAENMEDRHKELVKILTELKTMEREQEKTMVIMLRSLSDLATAIERLGKRLEEFEPKETVDEASKKMQEGIANLMAYGLPKAGEDR